MRLAPTQKHHLAYNKRISSAFLCLMLLLVTVLLLACNPFNNDEDEAEFKGGPLETVDVDLDTIELSSDGENPEAQSSSEEEGLMNTGESEAQAAPESTPESLAAVDSNTEIQTEEIPTPTVTAPEVAAAGTANDARNLAWAYLSQCISLAFGDLKARQIQGEWFVTATGGAPDKYGLWKVDTETGQVLAHNIRARQWDPLVNQSCTSEVFSAFFTPTPSPLLNADLTKASQAVITLWATLVGCYPNMLASDLDATLNQAEGNWVITTKPQINTNYGVWTVNSNGAVSPQNRQAQGVFDQLQGGIC